MPPSLVTVDGPLSPPQALHVNEVCDRFEAAWKNVGRAGERPRIEDFLAGTPEPDRLILLPHLVLLEIDYRRLCGEVPAATDYQARFPSLSQKFLAEAFPAHPDAPAGSGQTPGSEEAAGAGPAGGQPDTPTTVLPRPLAPQLRSDRYVVRQFHAHGGIGEIWKADDVEIGRQVALKRLRKKREEQQDRFLIEAQITGQLEHPGIVPVHDLGMDEEGRPFYIMTFIHGRTLKQVIDEYHSNTRVAIEARDLQRCRLLEVFVKVCQAVAYAHSRGVLHRDLKPDNVMLGEYGETLVLDWGMAKVRSQADHTQSYPSVHVTSSGGSSETRAGTILGSPAYMAPEAADGRAAEADERTDVYLLGATLYHILTGRAPREGRSYDEIVELARAVAPPAPRKLKADVPRALEAICQKAMAHRQPGRYANVEQLAEDVQRYLAGAPVAAYREPLPARAWRWCKRHRRAVGRSLAGALVLGLALFGIAWAHEASLEQDALRREAEVLRRCQQVRKDLKVFDRLAAERQFYATTTTPAGERSLYDDSARGEAAGQKAIMLGERLSKELAQLPLRAERDNFNKKQHDLLLLMVQAQGRQSPGPKALHQMLARLDRAASLHKPSRSYYRLRAQCYRLLGNQKRADEDERHAQQRGISATALDHFLMAEQYRMDAGSPANAPSGGLAWQPNSKLLTSAVAHYEKALRIEPDHYWCYFQMGRCYLSLGQGSEAVEALTTCVALAPKSAWGYSARGLALGLTKRYAAGKADLDQALVLEPKFRPALLNRGVLYWLQRKYDPALADFDKVLKPPEEDKLSAAAYYRGMLYLEQKKTPEALRDFDEALKKTPGFRPVYLIRAQVHFMKGDDSRGLGDLTTFLELARRPKPLDPKGAEVFALRGRLLLGLIPNWGLPDDEQHAKLVLARDHLQKAIQQGGGSPELLNDLGSLLFRLNEPEEALKIYGQALQKAPRRLKTVLLIKRGWIYAQYLKKPQPDKARDNFAAAAGLDPSNAEAHTGVGYLDALQKKFPEAQREAAQALLHGANQYLILHNVACIYAELSRFDKGRARKHQDMAVALLRRALKLAGRVGAGRQEIEFIRVEPSFAPLRGRQDFDELRAPDGS